MHQGVLFQLSFILFYVDHPDKKPLQVDFDECTAQPILAVIAILVAQEERT